MSKYMRIGSLLLSLIVATISMHAQSDGKVQTFGTLENGVYHNNLTGIELTVPSNWVVVGQATSSTPDAQHLQLKDSTSNLGGLILMKRRDANAADLQASMNGRLAAKAMQRNNFQGYTYRPESVQRTTINGRPALSAVADYVLAGQKMVEYLTWIDGEKSRALFAARVRPDELVDFQAAFDPVIRSAVVP